MAEQNLNSYGDHLRETTGTHGADIASQRIDDLDREALLQIISNKNSSLVCLDLGCGFGLQGIRFALLGADSHLFDILPEPTAVKCLTKENNVKLSYCMHDLRQLRRDALPERVDVAFSQRFVHYLTFAEAGILVQLVGSAMPKDSRFYISASGLESELGSNYSGSTAELRSRFAALSPEMQSKHGIYEPVCLYSKTDLNDLMETNGFKSSKVWSSEFGNVKGVFQKSA